MLMKSWYPPLSPLFFNGDTKLIPHSWYPGESSSDGYTVVYISFKDPYSEAFLQKEGIYPVTGVLKHCVVGAYIITAVIVVQRGDV